jgi:Mg-chelatase subunit ChlD
MIHIPVGVANLYFPGIDFVIVIDHSASMRLSHKLAFVQATIEYLISKLNEAHRFCLIKFNQEVSMVTNGLLAMTTENKQKSRSLLHDIKPQGLISW